MQRCVVCLASQDIMQQLTWGMLICGHGVRYCRRCEMAGRVGDVKDGKSVNASYTSLSERHEARGRPLQAVESGSRSFQSRKESSHVYLWRVREGKIGSEMRRARNELSVGLGGVWLVGADESERGSSSVEVKSRPMQAC